MSMDWARAFSHALGVPIAEVLTEFKVAEPEEAQHFEPGFSESEAVPFVGPERDKEAIRTIEDALGGGRPGVDLWTVKSSALAMLGYLQGDHILVDTHSSERTRAGDVVVAQIYEAGSAKTVIRRHQPPVLLAYGSDPADLRVHVVDGVNVVVRGKVIASWRKH